MASNSPRRHGEDSLNDSWVVFNQEGGDSGNGNSTNRPLSMYNGNMEKLLMEAQRESRSTSRGSSQGGSPKSPHSPVGSGANSGPGSTYSNGSDRSQTAPILPGPGAGLAQGTAEWIWDWSSRPEPLPPKEFRFKHPDHTRLSIRKSKAMKSNFLSTEVLSVFIPSLILTNLLTLGIGIYIGLRVISPRSS
ncbi:BCL2/adenovirus E1B 19 kDa protein-interacting protein 3-like [Acanthaster planci]|uniref:BCL2/adenovirus E1B 19 kDa protein-interacting protein 3-like n=1 Tax=Acanthaster planci TaxID=133434 RepID=A0A8B7XKX7_ACAPL|nr:BCL2/adenovirus E1B 19 kDa protein-interacting protein 3-like [Acanthaster planci]